MDFYSKLAAHYDIIFPLSDAKCSFLSRLLPETPVSLLDLGCATGSLLQELAQTRKHADRFYGLELNHQLLAQAKSRLGDNAHLHCGDMKDIKSIYNGMAFSHILCLGNTLAHLENETIIADFLHAAKLLLGPKGKLILQLVNFSKFSGKPGSPQLPAIKAGNVSFSRKYRQDAENHILFTGTLTAQEELTSTVTLYAITSSLLSRLAAEAGFISIDFQGDFKGSPYAEDSNAVVAILSI